MSGFVTREFEDFAIRGVLRTLHVLARHVYHARGCVRFYLVVGLCLLVIPTEKDTFDSFLMCSVRDIFRVLTLEN
jgi:hypothetical protein